MASCPPARRCSRWRRRALQACVLLSLGPLLGGPQPVHALSDSELYRDVRFRFLEPGTRAVALGGAFTAVAGDASSAYYNPAGLHFVSAPDVYLEYRSVDAETEVIDARTGGVELDPNNGPTALPYLEVFAAGEAEPIEELSFLSFAWPFRVGGARRNLTVALSRQLLLSTERTLGDTRASFAFDTFPNTVVGNELQVYAVETSSSGQLDADVVYYNASVSYDVSPDFSLGLTVSYAELDLAGRGATVITDPEQVFADSTHPRLAGQPDQDVYGTSAFSTDSDFAYTVGLHWHPDSVFSSGRSPWGFGLVISQGARFSVQEEVTFNQVVDSSFETKFTVPDRYAVGVSYRTPLHWTFAADYQRIEYSDLSSGFRAGVGFLASSRLAAASFEIANGASIEYDIKDSSVPRLGAEFRHHFRGSPRRALTAQLGYFRTESIAIRLTGFNSVDPAVNQALIDSFSEGGKLDHYSAGIGLLWGWFGFHFTGETSDAGSQVLASLTFGLDRRAWSAGGATP